MPVNTGTSEDFAENSTFTYMSTLLKILKARHGDAFILECKKEGSCFIMVIDSGTKLSIRDVVPQIKALPQIDLLVLPH